MFKQTARPMAMHFYGMHQTTAGLTALSMVSQQLYRWELLAVEQQRLSLSAELPHHNL
jgi:hypothetical protein